MVLAEMFIVLLAFLGALQFRYEGSIPPELMTILPFLIIPLLVCKMVSFAFTRVYHSWWRNVSLHDLPALISANLLGSSMFAFYLTVALEKRQISWSILVLDGLLCFLFMCGMRVGVRLVCEFFCEACKTCGKDVKRILVVGAGVAGQSIVREIRQNPKLNWKVLGFVDQDFKRQHRRFQGLPVLGPIEELGVLLRRNRIDQVILANPALNHKVLREIVTLCQRSGVKSKILPNVGDILNGELSIQQVRDVQLEDLLGRPPVRLDVSGISQCLGGKRILVTGAAGSIGSEICRQVAEFGARTVVLFDNSETPLFQVERELRRRYPSIEFIATLSDVRDAARVEHAFTEFNPEVVFHAAAYKHVPMSEQNPVTVVENNVIGTRILVDAADRHGIDRFVMVSTDKAVNPTNVMGASKRAAEIYAQGMARCSRTRIMTVRFGNVLGSNGSVVPIFQEQIRTGGPVTVTHPEATRFFMTIPEAVQLVLQAGSMGQGGEIFILDMGEQMHIVHLAEELIRLSGLTPYVDIDIVFSGLRPGEKLHEELLLAEEGVLPTTHEKICVARSAWHDLEFLQRQYDQLAVACRQMDRPQVILAIRTLVPQYHRKEETRTNPASRLSVVRSPRTTAVPISAAELA